MKNKYIPALLCGFGAAVFTTIPGIKNIACCLVLPLAAVISLLIFKRVNKLQIKIPTGTGLMLGLLTGITAALFSSFFDVLITYLTKSNDLILSLPQSKTIIKNWDLGPLVDDSIKLLEDMAREIKSSGFSSLYVIMITISNLIIYSIFGFLGGALGLAIVNKKKNNMITAILFGFHFLFAVIIFTKKWQEDGTGAAFLNIALIAILFTVGWTITGLIAKMFLEPEGFGLFFDRDTFSLTLLIVIEYFFYRFYYNEKLIAADKEIQ